jgi:hypothetical protein
VSTTPPTSFPPPGAKPIWGGYAGGSHAATSTAASTGAAPSPARTSSASPLATMISGGEPLEPLSRRLLQGAGFLSLLLIAVLANSFLQSSEENPLNPIAAAAERTQSEPGARYTMRARYTSSALPEPMTARGRGAYNSVTGLGEAQLQLDTPGLGWVEIESVNDEVTFYMRSDNEALLALPDGKEWMKVEPLLGASQDEVMIGSDAGSQLEMLGAVSNVQKVGQERVGGKQTERYRATIVLSDFADALREEGKNDLADLYEKYAALSPATQTTEAWIDDQGILRRMRMVMQLPLEDQPAMKMDLRMEFFDIGAEPAIALPDESQVFDATPLLEEQLDAVGTD